MFRIYPGLKRWCTFWVTLTLSFHHSCKYSISDDPECDKLGRQTWVVIAIICTEFLICVKFGWSTITKPLPRYIAMWWIAALLGLVVYTIVKFVIFKPTKLPKPEKEQLRLSPMHTNYSNDSEAIKADNNVIEESCDEDTGEGEYLIAEKSELELVMDINSSSYKSSMSSSNLSNSFKDKNV